MSRIGNRYVGSDNDDEESVENLYFGDEAEVGNETEDDESVADENDPLGNPLSHKGRKTLKVCRHFAYTLIASAKNMGWEDQEVANLIELVADQLKFDETKLMRCLEKTGVGSQPY